MALSGVGDTGQTYSRISGAAVFVRSYASISGNTSGEPLSASGTGIGIGLALMRAIVVKQNGSVKAENAKEGGAKFTVRFYKSSV